MSTLMEYLHNNANYNSLPSDLPLMHSCDGYDGTSIFNDERLDTNLCTVFGKNLLYFFYGKPSYSIGEKENKIRNDDLYCPVCFIFNPEKVNITKVYPFDSGAFQSGLYNSFFHKHMEIDNFEIENCLDEIKAYISVVFNTNDDYLVGTSHITTSNIRALDSLFRMINANGTVEFDERSRTIEVISDESIKLLDAIEYIILPENLMRDDIIKSFIIDNKIDYKTYTVRPCTRPNIYYNTVFENSMDFLREKWRK